MNALGELTLETTQTDGSGFAGGHGQLPQTGDRDHPNAVPRNLDQASRERLGGAWDGETVRDDHVGIESLAYFEEQGMLIPRTQSGALNLDWWWPPDEEDERLPDGTRGGTIHPDRARTRLEELAYEATVAKLPPRPLERGQPIEDQYALDDVQRIEQQFGLGVARDPVRLRELLGSNNDGVVAEAEEDDDEQVECGGEEGGRRGVTSYRLTSAAGCLTPPMCTLPKTRSTHEQTASGALETVGRLAPHASLQRYDRRSASVRSPNSS